MLGTTNTEVSIKDRVRKDQYELDINERVYIPEAYVYLDYDMKNNS